ncbi:MAG: hypothetical protein Q9185_000284 [Variospora sp. 1 TL-2023]
MLLNIFSPLCHQLLLLCVLVIPFSSVPVASRDPDYALGKRQTPIIPPLVNFQVSEPILTTVGDSNHYGMPFIGSYTPPPCTFNRVTINFTVTSRGRQFDRLGLMYLGDVEVFRTSTAEPTSNGIVWTYVKEMQQYNALWRTDQKIIFDLGNLIDSTYTASFNTTLTATFSTIPSSRAAADRILPISAKRSGTNGTSAFSLPGDNALVAYTIPQNTERAVVSLSACGQASEEFWYTNVFNTEVNTFEDQVGTLYGYSPFREVQLLIDGQLAGVSWPFPVIFTGGIVPGLWRPIAGINAFDLREHEIDITPWLTILCDGASHTFEIRVAGINNIGRGNASLSDIVGSTWIVTGKIFLFLGPEGSTTFGTAPRIDVSPPTLQISSGVTKNATGANETLTYRTSSTRSISITSTLKTSNGSVFPASWTQQLTYTNLNILLSQGFTQRTEQLTRGTDRSSSGYTSQYSYPLIINSTFSTSGGGVGITASLTRSLNLTIEGPSVFPSGIQFFNRTGSPAFFALPGHLSPVPYTTFPPPYLPSGACTTSTQSGSASYLSAGNASYSFGTTSQDFGFRGSEAVGVGGNAANEEFYTRRVRAVNASVVEDVEILIGRRLKSPLLGSNAKTSGEDLVQQGVGGRSVREFLGRGPGRSATLHSISGVDPIFMLALTAVAAGGAGWLLGPFVGEAAFRVVYRREWGRMAAKEKDFYARIRRHRVDPSLASYSNPLPDYYGEKIGSVQEFRTWMRDQRAYNRKRTSV